MNQYVLILTAFLFSIFSVNGQKRSISLIPKPAEIREGSGSFRLKGPAVVSFRQPTLQKLADGFAGKLNGQTRVAVSVLQGNSGSIRLELSEKKLPVIGNEGYQLSVETDRVLLQANTETGLFYGIQTLLQLLPLKSDLANGNPSGSEIPCLSITDYPRFAWRGMMLDVSRHFFTKEEVKKYIDEIARYKFNTFHWHLTDDNGWRVEIKAYPKLTSVGAWRVPRFGAFGSSDRKPPMPGEAATYGGFYTQDDVREVVAFAKERGVTIVPEIDVPGHCMAAIAAYPELCCTKDTSIRVNPGSKFSDWFGNGMFRMNIDNSLNPSDEKVYQFLDKVFGELAQLFPGQYIHVGGDECYKGYWEKDSACKALMEKLKIRHVEDLQGYFMNRVKDMVKAKGKKTIGWDEVLEGGISNEATLMLWRGWLSKEIIRKAKTGGYKVVMSPTNTNYFDYYQGDRTIEPPVYANLRLKDAYKFEPLPEGADEKMILGGQANLWTESVQNFRHAEYMTFPRAWATSEVLWSPKGTNANWSDFVERVEANIGRAEAEGIKVARSIYDPVVQFKKEKGVLLVELSSEVSGVDFFYTLDESMPDSLSTRYKEPIRIPTEGAITLRIQAYRAGKQCGHLITLRPDLLKEKSK